MTMKRLAIIAVAALAAMACSQEQAHETRVRAHDAAKHVAQKVSDSLDVSAPLGARTPPLTPQQIEQARFDRQWRQLQSFRAAEAARVAAAQTEAAAQTQLNLNIVHGMKESFKGLDANAINSAPINVPITGDVRGPSVLKTQV